MSSKHRTGIGSGLTLLLALIPFMLDQYHVQSPFFGSLAFVGMIAVGLFTVWNLPFRNPTRWICIICFLIGSGVLGWWLNNHRRTQQAVTQRVPEISQQSKGQQSLNTVGNQNSVVAPQTTGSYSPILMGNDNKVFYGKTPAQEQQEREERKRALAQQREAIRAHIFLAEKYGREWHGNDEEIRFWRREGQRDILRKPYNPNLPEDPGSWPRFTPEVCHDVRGLVISHATIYLKIPQNIVVKPLPGHVDPPPAQQWTLATQMRNQNHYYTLVAQTTEALCSGVIQSLALKFPGPATYPVEYTLSLPIVGLGDVQGTFYFELTD